MKTAAVVGAASLLCSLVGAVPLNKRAIHYEIQTEIVTITTTIWVDAADATPDPDPSYDSWEGTYDHDDSDAIKSSSTSSVSAPTTPPPPPPAPVTTSSPAPAPTSTAPPPPPVVEDPPAPVYNPPPPVEDAEPEEPVYEPADEPVVEPVAEPVPEPVYEPVEEPVNVPEPAPVETPSGGYEHTGELTYYDPGLGSCGITSGPGEAVVAVSHVLMDQYNTGNPNNNPLCGKTITAEYQGKVQTLKIVDRCTGCAPDDIDVSPSAFEAMTGDKGLGRVQCSWKMNA